MDFYEHKPPGLFYAYALIVAIFGDSVEGLHVGFTLLNLATIVVLFAVGRRLLGSLGGGVVAVSFAVLSLAPGVSGFAIQSEHILAFLGSCSLLLLLRAFDADERMWWTLFAAGAISSVALFVKQNGLFFVVAAFAVVGAHALAEKRRLSRVAGDWLAVGAGVGFVAVAFVAHMLQIGAFEGFWFWAVDFSFTYVTLISTESGSSNLLRYGAVVTEGVRALWLAAAVGLVVLVASGGTAVRTKLVLTCFVVLSLAAVFPGMRFYGHYFLQALPAIALLVGALFSATYRGLEGALPRQATRLAVVLLGFALIVGHSLASEAAYFTRPDPQQVLRRVYHLNPFYEARMVGNFLLDRMDEDDQLVVIGSEPQIYLYTRKRLPSRHAYFEFVVTRHPKQPEWQREFILDVERAGPEYLVFFEHALSLQGGDGDPEQVGRFLRWLEGYIDRKGYRRVGFVDLTDPEQSEYIWGEAAAEHRGKGGPVISVWERKS